MNLKDTYLEVLKRLNKLNFTSIWPSFKQYEFILYRSDKALYNGEEIPYDKAFIGNTSILYNNKQVAIWNYECDFIYDLDILTAKIVHEMIHCMQIDNKDERFPNDFHLLDYPYNEENLSIKYEENKVLYNLLKNTNQNTISYFMFLRKERCQLFGSFIEDEFKVETIEGLADYAFLVSLKSLSEKKYTKELNFFLQKLIDQKLLMDARRGSYFSGALLLLVLKENNLIGVDNEKDSFYHQLTKIIDCTKYSYIKEKGIKDIIDARLMQCRAVIEEVTSTKSFKKINAIIKGYDPMNMFKINDLIFCKNFIMLEVEGITNFYNGPLVLVFSENKVNGIYM